MKKGRIVLYVFLIILVIIIVVGIIGWQFLKKEHKEARNVVIENIDFSTLKDGTYIGEYEGGMYELRHNKVEVTVSDGKVTNMKLISSTESKTGQSKIYMVISERVIENQSLDVDTVSGATLTSKAYLKGIELALKQAK